MNQAKFFINDEAEWESVEAGIKRKILPFTDGLMAVCVSFEKGAVGTVHSHDIHDQIAICLQGAFEVNLAGEKRVIKAGDAFLAGKGTPHGVVALEDDSRLLDTFNPHRDDFVS
ncbi:cupin domain-containing protein [Glaciecola sp. SC05]|uniref:cupin domain-containing protein n=1 Tax=Glaciecola sp. SC05 TaxID=1987355 RepID=UPI003529132A